MSNNPVIQSLRKFDSMVGKYFDGGAQIILALIALAALFTCINYQARATLFPYQLDYAEAPLVDQAMRLVQGQNIYRSDISTPPYTISNYPPLYVLLLAVSVKLVGPASTFMVGRMLSVLSAWIAALCLFLIVGRQFHDRLAAGVAALVLLTFPYVVTWSSLMRIDSVALALSLSALAVLVTKPVTFRRLLAVATLLTAAIFTRQTYALAAPFAAFVWLLAQDWRKALQLVFLVGGASMVLFLSINIPTHGGFFFNIVTANVNEFKMDILQYHWGRIREIAMIFILSGGLSFFLIRRWNPLWMLAAPYLFASVLSALTIGKIGSNVNYLLELCAALSLATGIVIAAGRKYIPSRTVQAILLLVLCYGLGRMIYFTREDYSAELSHRYATLNDITRLSELVANTPGDILADEYMGMVTQQGRPLAIQPFEVTQLSRAGKWDQTPLLNSIQNKEYAAIILYDQPWIGERWTDEMLDAVERYYVLTDIVAGNKVYKSLQRNVSNEITSCTGAVWQSPSSASLGVQIQDDGLAFFGRGKEGELPVYAAADGLLTRLLDRPDAVAIQMEDPLHPNKTIWVLYEGMASANGLNSYIAPEFQSGSSKVPVKAGQLIGYQGTWSGIPQWSTWTHVTLSVFEASEETSFPENIASATPLDPAQYLGLTIDNSNQNLQVWRCNQP